MEGRNNTELRHEMRGSSPLVSHRPPQTPLVRYTAENFVAKARFPLCNGDLADKGGEILLHGGKSGDWRASKVLRRFLMRTRERRLPGLSRPIPDGLCSGEMVKQDLN
jgi:hypothetical protein